MLSKRTGKKFKRINYFSLCFCLSLFLASASISYAQLSISGKVMDAETNMPMPGAHVILVNTYFATATNAAGDFHIKNLKPGTYIVKATYLGYKKEVREIDLKADTVIGFSLQQSPVMGDEVIIIATRASDKSPMTYTKVNKKEIQQINLGQDLPYLIQSSPSVVTTSDAGTGIGYTGIRIRGTDLTRINVTINGIPLNDAESQGVWWVDLPDISSSVDDIQIQRGVGTSTNGAAAFGASLNIRTQNLRPDPYAELDGSFGSFNTWKTTVSAGTGLINEKWAMDARFSRIHSDGYIDRAFADLLSFYASGGYFGRKTMIKATVFSGIERTYQAWDGVPSDVIDTNRTYNGLGKYTDFYGNTQFYDNQTDNYKQTHYQLYWLQEINLKWNFNMALHYTKGKGYYEEYKEDQAFTDYGWIDPVVGDSLITETDLVRQRWLDNDFYGVTFAFNHDNRKRLRLNIGGSFNYYEGDHFGEIIWAEIAVTLYKDFRWYENTGFKKDFNLYGKVQYQLSDKLNLYGDLQFRRIDYRIDGRDNDLRDITQAHLYHFFNPKLGLYYEFDQRNKAYASFAVGNREPNRSALIDASPFRPYPIHETLYDLEAGYQLLSTKMTFEATFYYMLYKNQLVMTGRINDVGDAVMENVPHSYRSGIELSLGINILRNLNWSVNATFSRNKVRDFISYTDNWDLWPFQIKDTLASTDISFSPALLFSSVLDYAPIKNLHLVLYSKYVGKQYIDNTSSNERKLDPYFVNDLLVSYSIYPGFMKEMVFSLKINNIFNTQYESNAWIYRYYYDNAYHHMDGYFPQAGINFLAGIAFRF